MDIDCPYGASSCPKVQTLEKTLEKNTEELDNLKLEVTKLNTTIRNASVLLTTVVSILIALMELMR